MIVVERACAEDLDEVVALETKLFQEDAGVHGTFADITWPEREGAADFTRLLDSTSCVVLVARDGGAVIGHLVGYVGGRSPTRQPITYASLRSMYVQASHRRQGVGVQLVEAFLTWAREQGCAEATVDSYVANTAAQHLCARMGFAPQSISAVMRL